MLFLVAVLAAPLAVVLGVLWFYVKGLFAQSPDGESVWTSHRVRLLCYTFVFLTIVALGKTQVVPNWGMQIDEERDFIMSSICADGNGCPLVGNEMNQLRIKLGPLNRYLMTLCQLVTPDPRFTLWSILVLHALGAAWLAAAGDRLLGFPFGLLAGLLFGSNRLLLEVVAAASNGAWSSFFQVGAIAGTLRWVRGNTRGLIIAVTCLAAACQLHGTNLVFVPPFLLAALYWRPPMPRRAVILCVLIVGALYSSWLVYQFQTGWSDFSMISTSWMVSEGPKLADRLARVFFSLDGTAVTALVLAGAVALATGWRIPPSERAAARVVPLFLALPLAAALLAGGNWSERYGAPMVAPAALAAAAALQLVASLLPGGERWKPRYGAAMTAAGLALVMNSVVTGSQLGSHEATVSASRRQLGLAEQIEAVRVLGEHGFGAADLESRVHGMAWTRWGGGQAYLGHWLIPTGNRAKPGEQAVVLNCGMVSPASSVSWKHHFATARGVPHTLVGYERELSPVKVEFLDRDGVFWTSENAMPFYGQMVHGGDAQLRLLFDPQLAYPSEFAQLQTRWPNDEPFKMRLTATLGPDRADRLLVLAHDAGLTATVTFDGKPRTGTKAARAFGGDVRHHFPVEAAERGSEIHIEALIDLPPGAMVPRRVDLYEEPPCDATPLI